MINRDPVASAPEEPTAMNLEMPRFDLARVLVLGDIMLDRYWDGSTARISPWTPTCSWWNLSVSR